MTQGDPALQDKICLVTAATAGIGEATARQLARRGATVIVVGRNRAKGERVVQQIRQVAGHPRVELMLADLSSQKDIHTLAAQFKARYA